MLAGFICGLGRVPLLGRLLRRLARTYRDGSVATIPYGAAAGLKWVRHEAYVSGYWLGIYERHLQAAIVRELTPGQVFYDVGANAGFFSILASRIVGPSGQVFAFEPLPSNADVVSEQIAVNGIKNVRVVRCAVVRDSGEERLLLTADSSTPRIAGDADPGCGEWLTVPALSLDDFVKGHPPPDLVKMDIEGAEADALEGSAKLIARHHPAFLIELHGEGIAHRVMRFLGRWDYVISRPDGRPLGVSGYQRQILARKGPKEGRGRL